ncbi:MAG: integrase arm-type DNA-binding domain-containing protein [Deltaproteobacteria bacterium]
MKFTDIYIKNQKPEPTKYYKREAHGFAVKVWPSGVKTWVYIYTFESKRKEMRLGEYPAMKLADARTKYNEAYELHKNGRDPGAEERQQKEERRLADTIEDLVKEYIKKHAKVNKRSWKNDERLLNKEVVTIWGDRKAEDIRKRDVVLLLESIVERGSPAMSNQTLKIVRKMFNFAVERDILHHTPCTGVKALAPNNSRERTLNEAEIKALWANLDAGIISDEIKRALKLILVTAQRPGEVIGMRAAEIDKHWWTIPSERAKNGRTHRVYLTNLAVSLIGDTKGKDFLFPCPHKKKIKQIEAHAVGVAVRRNLAWPVTNKNGKPLFDTDGNPVTENKLGIEQFTPHDLRRTAATFLAKMGNMDEVIDAVLNHAKQGVIKVYNQYRYDTEKQKALEAWERKLNSIIKGEKGKVISIGNKKSA